MISDIYISLMKELRVPSPCRVFLDLFESGGILNLANCQRILRYKWLRCALVNHFQFGLVVVVIFFKKGSSPDSVSVSLCYHYLFISKDSEKQEEACQNEHNSDNLFFSPASIKA